MTSKQAALTSASIAAMSLEQLQVLHSEMAATAGDLGFSIPDNLTVEFETQEAGIIICDELNAQIEKFRSGLDETRPGSSSTDGQKPLAEGDKGEDSAPASGKKPRSSAKKPKSDAPASTTPKPDKGKAEPKEAKMATAKKAAKKTAKKTVAKKAAKKTAAPKGDSKPRIKFDENAKVTFVPAENPCRAGSARFDRYELLRKGSGKTVKTLLAQGVPSATLANAVAKKIIKIG